MSGSKNSGQLKSGLRSFKGNTMNEDVGPMSFGGTLNPRYLGSMRTGRQMSGVSYG